MSFPGWGQYAGNDPVNTVDRTGLEYEAIEPVEVKATREDPWAALAKYLLLAQIREMDSRGGPSIRDDAREPQSGHDYDTKNNVCKRPLTDAESKDLLSRYSVPNVFITGSPIDDGWHIVTNGWGVPGGIVTTVYSSDGLSAANTTTPVHAFVGTISHTITSGPDGTYISTHGTGDAGSSYIGQFRDKANQEFGPGIFNKLDARAAKYAAKNLPGC